MTRTLAEIEIPERSFALRAREEVLAVVREQKGLTVDEVVRHIRSSSPQFPEEDLKSATLSLINGGRLRLTSQGRLWVKQ